MLTADVSGSNSWAEDVLDFVAREHAMVREHLAQMLAIAAVTPTEIAIDQRERLSSVFQFVHTELLPLMSLEEASVYPVLRQIPGVPSTPEAMTRDHEAVRQVIAELDDLAGQDGWGRWGAPLNRPLLDLVRLVRLHLAREEGLYGPLLSQLDPRSLATLRERLVAHRSGTSGLREDGEFGASPMCPTGQTDERLKGRVDVE